MQLQMRPDPTFYPSARLAMQAPREKLAYVAMLSADGNGTRDGLAVVDVDPDSKSYGKRIGELVVTETGDELHHFGWNACSAALCPYAPHPHVERRYLLLTGLRSSRIYVVDTKPDPRKPHIVKTIEPDQVKNRSGYSRLHTTHCGPDGIYMSALGSADGTGPGGVLILDHYNFDVLGRWEVDRGPQYLAYDFWWHLGHDVMVTSEWGTPDMIEDGLNPELLLGGKYGHQLHFWDFRKRKHLQTVDFGAENQAVLELRPSHNPTNTYGFVNVVISLKDLSSSIWVWHRDNGKWAATKVIDIPAEPADAEKLPPLLKGFNAVPPLLADIDLSLDDRFLYASCWGTGEMRQYDVSDPFKPKLVGSVHLGGIVRRTPHPAKPDQPLNGGPQMVEISRDGKRIYFTNSLYRSWDDQFYPDGVKSWMVKFDVGAEGGITPDNKFFLEFNDRRAHQVRLEGGDSSSDSYCYP
ncbi:MAG: selenium-binding protein [Candidatus Eremiobacter antarcticus]|nr:selenium-binding family protein [Candidatus Eremiobacteraeota bacterium]MBC5808015.1 selenium-binding family protein [Candidatus Eremiobacteraeota bacterium]PZR62628.1 MAG: selenium-binding protein [Candidatus Eremiobacter sp. RRmetagenome_bin22]